MAITINEDGSQRKRKKGEPFNVSSLGQFSGTDKRYPSDGPGSLLDKNLEDRDKPLRGYPSDKEFPSGTFPLAKNKKKKKSRKA